MDDVDNTSDTGKSSEQAAPNQSEAQRDDKGRFGKDSRGASGNPFARQTAKLHQAALEAVSDDDIHDIISSRGEPMQTAESGAQWTDGNG